jgi:hypothetical protein
MVATERRKQMKKWNYFSSGLVALYVVLTFLIFLSSCAGIGKPMAASETAVVTYEGVALGLNAMKAFIKGREISGQLKGEDLDKVIGQWEQARQLFLQAGETLKASIAAQEPATQQQKIEAYNALLQKAAFELGKLDYLKGG